MSNKKSTKHAWLFSLTAMLLCVALLIGTTFAWFTDSASTAVNKIQAGTLDVALEMKNADGSWGTAEGKTLNWKKAADAVDEAVLWEPGCTYVLPELRIVNNGNLALKYKMIVSGIVGDAKLLEAIDFTVTGVDGAATADALNGFEGKLAADSTTDAITISGHMKEEAGNEYQGLSIDGIGITVVATQDTVEHDSHSDRYDKDATYPVVADLVNVTIEGNITVANGGTLTDENTDVAIVVPAGAVVQDTSAVFKMELTESKPDSVTYEISLKDQNGNTIALSEKATVTADIGENLINVQVAHNGTPMDSADFSYDRTTGILTIRTSSFSPFIITYEFDGVASVNGTKYPTVNAAIIAAKDGDTVTVLKDITSDDAILTLREEKEITVDMKGRTWTYTSDDTSIQLYNGAAVTLKNGTINMPNKPWYGIFVAANSSLAMNNIKVNSTDAGIFSQGSNIKVVIENSYVKSVYTAVYHNGSFAPADITIKDSELISDGEDPCVYISNSAGRERQTLTVVNSTVTGTTAIEVKHTDATITGSTIIATAQPSYTSNNNGSTTSGYCVVVSGNGINDITTGSVTLAGNTYQPAAPGCEVFNSSAVNGVNTGATINGYDNAHVLSPDKLLPVCRIKDTNTVYYSAYDLRDATAATLKNQTVVVQSDEVLSNEVYLSGKAFTLDLNGHSLSLEYGEGVTPNNGSVIYIAGKNSKLTITDSSQAQTGAIYGSNKNYANKVTSAVRAGNYGRLIINGGHFYGMSEGTSCIYVHTSRADSSYATVTINGGSFETVSPSGDTYFVLNHEDKATTSCKITVNGGKFKNYNPGVTTVDPVNAYTGKIVLGSGCTTTSETIGSDIWYTVSK